MYTEAVHGEGSGNKVVDLRHVRRFIGGCREALELQNQYFGQQLVLNGPLGLVQSRAFGAQILVVFPQRF